MTDRKLRLADALEKERDRLPQYSTFGEENDLSGYEEAIVYLRTGKLPSKYEDNEILLGCVEDLEMMFSDYGID